MNFRALFAQRHRTLLLLTLLALSAPALVQAGSALSFDGVKDYVTFGSTSALGATNFTIEVWFKRQGAGVSTSTGFGGIDAIPLVAKGRAEVDGTNQDMNYFLGLRPSDNVLIADFEEGATGTSPGLNHPVAGHTAISNGVWYHAAVSYDGSRWQLFLNGALETELIVGQPPRADSIQHASLGSALNSSGAAAGFFNGVLDEVRIWNYARTAADIAANRDFEITSAPGLIGRWGLNEGAGTSVTSSSGTGVIGTLVNGPLWTSGFFVAAPPVVTRGPYLQNGSASSITVRWRTDQPPNSRVRFGTAPGSLIFNADDAAVTTEHIVRLTGLGAGTLYYYSVGSTATTLASGADFTFQTAPPIGSAVPTRIWAIGDSGEGTPAAAVVRDAYQTYTGIRGTNVWLMLGDNAYENGTDAEYQTTMFNMYAQPLRGNVLWPTIGNHDTAQSATPPTSLPYFNIFTLPANGEAGGVASGTNRYYSFDYGSVHFVCLDSMTSSRQTGSAMLTWLQNDLAATTQKWVIAYWHHAPYSKGIIDSDTDPNSTDMRSNVLPILESRGVDLVLCGHSHDYERSFLLNGHYGFSGTLTSAMILNGGNGREDGSGAYLKPAGLSANKGTVYVVAGSASETLLGPLNHPAMYASFARLGSLVIDVDGNRLDARFLRETGVIDDYFTIRKEIPANAPPSVSLTSPAQNATFTAPASVTITAAASDADGTVQKVDFYANGQLLVSRTVAPWTYVWSNVPAGSYSLTAVATDNSGASTTSAPVAITVTGVAAPASPSSLTASAISRKQIDLAWTDNAANETAINVYRSNDGTSFNKIATLAANSTSYSSTGLTSRRTYYYQVTASNSAGESAPSNTAVATTR